MSFTRPQNVRSAPVPKLPTGTQIAVYATYAEAQKAVHYLSAEHFPVEHITIFGTNLHSVERVTGRLSYGRVAIAGAMSGAWFGLFIGLLLSLFGGPGVTTGITFIAITLGAGFGLLFSVLSYAVTRSRRDFTSSSQIVAGQYAILCEPDHAVAAQQVLQRSPVGIHSTGTAGSAGVVAVPVVTSPTTTGATPTVEVTPVAVGEVVTVTEPVIVASDAARSSEPWKPDPRWLDENGRPKYGAMADDAGAAAAGLAGVGAGTAGVGYAAAPGANLAEPQPQPQVGLVSAATNLQAPAEVPVLPNQTKAQPSDPYAPPPGTYKK